jgi:hypothetical protein
MRDEVAAARHERVQHDIVIPDSFDGTAAAPSADRHLERDNLPRRRAASRGTGPGVRAARRFHAEIDLPPLSRERQASDRLHSPVAPAAPMLTRSGSLPTRGDWAYEVKWDGFRAIVSTEGTPLRVRSRRGWDMTELVPELGALPVAGTFSRQSAITPATVSNSCSPLKRRRDTAAKLRIGPMVEPGTRASLLAPIPWRRCRPVLPECRVACF